jgi:HemY protein
MKRILILLSLLALLLVGLALGPKIAEYKGYVLVVMENGTLQMSIFGLLFSLCMSLICLWLVIWLGRKIIRLFSGSHSWLGSWGERKKQQAFEQGLFALAEGNYAQAQSQLGKIEQEDFNGLNLLAAAEVAINLQQEEKARYLWKLASSYPQAALAANLCLIKDQLHHKQSSEALQIIHSLDEKQQANAGIIKLWASALAQSGRWTELQEKLVGWKKALASDYDKWLQRTSEGSFAEIASKHGANQLKQTWLDAPRAFRKDPARQAAYISQLMKQGMFQDAEKALVEYQRSGPHPLLLPLFKDLKLPNPTASIKKLENWLKIDGNNITLLSTLGHLAFHARDNVLAEKALNKAIKLGNRPQDLLLLANLREAQHDNVQALQLYKQSMQSS